MMHRFIYRNMLKGKKMLISHYLNIKLLIITDIVKKNPDLRIIIVDQNRLLEKTGLINNLPQDTIIADNMPLQIPRGVKLIIIEPENIPWRINNDALITTTPLERRRIPRYFDKILLDKVGELDYQITFLKTMEKYRFRVKDHEIILIEKPLGVYGEALKLIEDAVIEYGELTIKDAVNMLMNQLGLDKNSARKIIGKLVYDKHIVVKKGRITL